MAPVPLALRVAARCLIYARLVRCLMEPYLAFSRSHISCCRFFCSSRKSTPSRLGGGLSRDSASSGVRGAVVEIVGGDRTGERLDGVRICGVVAATVGAEVLPPPAGPIYLLNVLTCLPWR